MHRIGPRNSWGRLGGKMVSPFLPKQKVGPGAEATGALTASRRPASNQSAGKGVAPIKVGHMESMEGNMAGAPHVFDAALPLLFHALTASTSCPAISSRAQLLRLPPPPAAPSYCLLPAPSNTRRSLLLFPALQLRTSPMG